MKFKKTSNGWRLLDKPVDDPMPKPDQNKPVRNTRHSLNILNVNCNGIRGKAPRLETVIIDDDIDIIIGTESKFNPEVYDAEVFPSNFRIYRRDRITGEGGGGVFIAVETQYPVLKDQTYLSKIQN